MKKWIFTGFLVLIALTAAQAQHHCLVKVAPQPDTHKMDVVADCGSQPSHLLFAEGLQNTLKNQISVIGVLDYMVDRNWEMITMVKTIKTPGTAEKAPIYYTEFLFRKILLPNRE